MPGKITVEFLLAVNIFLVMTISSVAWVKKTMNQLKVSLDQMELSKNGKEKLMSKWQKLQNDMSAALAKGKT